MWNDPVISKLVRTPMKWIEMDGIFLRVLPEGVFTKEEIEKLKGYEKRNIENGNPPDIANFLPDSIRPSNIPKM